MIHKENWGFNPDWLDYVKANWVDGGRVQQIKIQTDISLSFRERAKKAFDDMNIPTKQIKTWISIQVPKQGEGYDVGYPHIHYPLDGTTLVHYLQPGDVPAPLDIFEDDEVIETIYPEQGMTVFMPNNLRHGVRLNKGKTNRIQMIATALRR